jgi:Bacterial Ig-like domain (group 2)
MSLQTTTPASTTGEFRGAPNPLDGTSPTQQNGSWASSGGNNPVTACIEAVANQTKVSISASNILQVGAPNQFSLTVSLAGGPVQLQAHVNSATNVNTDPPLDVFTWYSRQKYVCTVSSTGLLTPTGRGSTTVEARYSRSANLPFPNASPSGSEFAYATVDVVVIP